MLQNNEDHPGEEGLEGKNPEEAVRVYQAMVELFPKDDSYRLKLAWAYLDNGQIEEAIACFEDIFEREVSRNVFTGFAFDELVRIYKQEGMTDRLVKLCERAAVAYPEDVSLLGDLGDAYMRAQLPHKAVEVFQRMIIMDPQDTMAYCRLGEALIVINDLKGAEEAFERAATIDPDGAGIYYEHMARAYLEVSMPEGALSALKLCIAFDATQPSYYLTMGDILVEMGDVEGAFGAYAQAADLRREFTGSYYHRLGNTLFKTSHFEEACRAFNLAAEAEPMTPIHLIRLAEASLAMGDEKQALEALAKLEKIQR
ncbi:MAG: tetratricopeptide repeat protein [Syntrophales bacterium]|nr:tetratricopeptide repeat protein [Syntrophales bacterium]